MESQYDGLNAGIVNENDLVEYWTTDNGYYLLLSKKPTHVLSLPANTYKCYVNQELRVNLPYKKP